MKRAIVVPALLAIAIVIVIVLILRLSSEDAIRLAGYAATAAIAVLVSLLTRRRANRSSHVDGGSH
ncbi:hypothetical protein ACAX43_24155 [Paraburkholderia sp. IW21]|uniref:hypothetical protein n=1 Tax=Paraburkholderia sp. IW21 TaxID=3242488 RepID=UPI0035212BF6